MEHADEKRREEIEQLLMDADNKPKDKRAKKFAELSAALG